MEPVFEEKDRNVARSIEFIETAAENGAKLIVLPELCNSGYVFETREEAFALAEEIPSGATCRAWAEAAARLGVRVVAGISERAGQALYN